MDSRGTFIKRTGSVLNVRARQRKECERTLESEAELIEELGDHHH